MTRKDKLQYLSQEALGNDDSLDKSQQKLAASIASLLTKKHEGVNPQKNILPKVIGLEGRWGSGKSNLLKHLESELCGSHVMYVYNAWGHQEDEQRRTLLEGVTKFLVDKERKGPFAGVAKWTSKARDLCSLKRYTATNLKVTLGMGTFVFPILGWVASFIKSKMLGFSIVYNNDRMAFGPYCCC